MIITEEQITIFFLIFARISAVIMLSPGFSERTIFSMGKIALIFWISTYFSICNPTTIILTNNANYFFTAIFIEFLIGAIIGFITRLIIDGIEFGGSLMDTQAKLSVASLLDPATGQTTSILSRLVRHISVLVFIN